MKIYFAVTGQQEPQYLPANGLNKLLCSFHYYKKDEELIKKLIAEGCDLFIDSGAFSAANAGSKIDIDEYSRFILKTGVKFYAGLDVIGDAVGTKSNQRYMESKYSLKPIPTFHMGEPLEFALEMANEYEYMAVGGMVFSEGIEGWLDNLWNQLLKVNKDIKCHGFGLTNSKLIEKYPWESVDSSSFKSGKRFGRIILYNAARNELVTEDFNNWVDRYADLTRDDQILEDSAFRYMTTDVLSAKAYNRFADYLNSKGKDYTHLTSQTTLF